MSKLIEAIKDICEEENIDFEEFKTNLENEPKKFSFEEVVKGDSKYLTSLIKKELDKPKLRSGEQIRINTLKTLCELIETQNNRLDKIENLLITIKNKV